MYNCNGTQIRLEAAPRYVLTVQTLKPREAIALAKQVITIVDSALKDMGGHLAVTQEPKLQLPSVSGTKHARRRHKNGLALASCETHSPPQTQTQTQTEARTQQSSSREGKE